MSGLLRILYPTYDAPPERGSPSGGRFTKGKLWESAHVGGGAGGGRPAQGIPEGGSLNQTEQDHRFREVECDTKTP